MAKTDEESYDRKETMGKPTPRKKARNDMVIFVIFIRMIEESIW